MLEATELLDLDDEAGPNGVGMQQDGIAQVDGAGQPLGQILLDSQRPPTQAQDMLLGIFIGTDLG